jgi:hypothetical protein
MLQMDIILEVSGTRGERLILSWKEGNQPSDCIRPQVISWGSGWTTASNVQGSFCLYHTHHTFSVESCQDYLRLHKYLTSSHSTRINQKACLYCLDSSHIMMKHLLNTNCMPAAETGNWWKLAFTPFTTSRGEFYQPHIIGEETGALKVLLHTLEAKLYL